MRRRSLLILGGPSPTRLNTYHWPSWAIPTARVIALVAIALGGAAGIVWMEQVK
jgi:hypothetical protein